MWSERPSGRSRPRWLACAQPLRMRHQYWVARHDARPQPHGLIGHTRSSAVVTTRVRRPIDPSRRDGLSFWTEGRTQRRVLPVRPLPRTHRRRRPIASRRVPIGHSQHPRRARQVTPLPGAGGRGEGRAKHLSDDPGYRLMNFSRRPSFLRYLVGSSRRWRPEPMALSRPRASRTAPPALGLGPT